MPYFHENLTKYPNHPKARPPLAKAVGTLEGMGRVEGVKARDESKESKHEEKHETAAEEKAEY